MADVNTSQGEDIDLDEDLFNFEVPKVEEISEEEEDLEAIFAAFQSEEKAREEAEASSLAGEPDPSENDSASWASSMSDGEQADLGATGDGSAEQDLAASRGDAGGGAAQAGESGSKIRASAASRLIQVAGPVSKSTLLILISVTMLNGLVAFISLRSATTMRDTVMQAERRMSHTADQIRGETLDQARKIVELRKPLVQPNTEDHPTFTRAADLIREGNYVEARARIYALLAIIDRLEEPHRQDVEARAQFLLAEASHLEALNRYGEEQR